jgi:transposase
LKKRVYQAVTVGKVNIEKLLVQTLDKRIVFSVDVAKEIFFGTLYSERKEVLQTIKWKSPNDVELMLELLKGLKTARLEVVMEPTGTYGDAFREQVEKQGFPVFLVSPKRCHDLREVYDGVPSSHDAKAAAVIGKMHFDGLSTPWPEKDERQRRLLAGLSMVDTYQRQYHDNLNRLEAQLSRYWPELPEILSTTSASLPCLLKAYGGPRKVAADTENSRDVLRKSGHGALSHTKVEKVLSSASGTIGVTMIPAEEEALMALAKEIDRNRVALREAKRKVEKIMGGAEQSSGVTEMSRAVGVITCAILLCKIGDPGSYDSAGAWLKAAGLNLKVRSSGKYMGILKITKRGPGAVRRYLYMAVLRFINNDEIVRRWYGKKVKRDGGRKGRAIVALMRKLAVGLWKAGRDGVPFDSAKLFDTTRLSAV